MVFGSNDNGGSIMFSTTCLLLGCRALRQCPTPAIEKRWRRWQSLLLETVRLFQQHFVGRRLTMTTKNAKLWVSSSLDVGCRHVLPALAHVQQALMLSTTIPQSSTGILPTSGEAGGPSHPPPPPRWMVLEAGTVWCVARLAVNVLVVAAAATNNHHNSDAATAHAKKQLRSLLVACDRHILRGRYELLYEHPWWRRREPTQDDERPRTTTTKSASPSSSDAAVLAYYTTDLVDDDDDSAEAEEERRDEVLGLQTVWSDLGIAVLAAAVGWTERPNVWTAEYQWRMFFPHVAVLLLAQDDDDDPFGCCYDEGEDAAAEGVDPENDNRSDDINSSVIVAARLLGFDLLHNLLQHTPDRSAITPGSRDAPDCPIGTLQLIANQIIIVSGSALEQGQASEWGTTLPNASRSFQLMRSLVGKYCPAYQVTIVQTLYHDCPHPGLRPKLLDLLRSFVAWEDARAVQDVWLFLDAQVLSSLASHVGGTFPTNNGPMDVSSLSFSVEELVNHVEVYSAALGLIQLWLLCVRKAPTTPAAATTFADDLEQRLASIHGSVQRIIAAIPAAAEQQHSTNAAPLTAPAEHHRLLLLESSLKQTVELLASLSPTPEMAKQ